MEFAIQRLGIKPDVQDNTRLRHERPQNALHRGGPNVSPLLAGLDTGFAIRLNGTALDEIVAHSLPQERERLRTLCRRLLANGAGDVPESAALSARLLFASNAQTASWALRLWPSAEPMTLREKASSTTARYT